MATRRRGASSAMIVAALALVVSIAAIALPFVSGMMETSTTTPGTPQTREFYTVADELAFNSTAAGIPHYVYNPTQLTVSKGDKVVIHFYDTTDSSHTFTLPGYSINVSLDPGKKQDIQFTAITSGVFMFNCNVHPTTMRGELIVLP